MKQMLHLFQSDIHKKLISFLSIFLSFKKTYNKKSWIIKNKHYIKNKIGHSSSNSQKLHKMHHLIYCIRVLFLTKIVSETGTQFRPCHMTSFWNIGNLFAFMISCQVLCNHVVTICNFSAAFLRKLMRKTAEEVEVDGNVGVWGLFTQHTKEFPLPSM